MTYDADAAALAGRLLAASLEGAATVTLIWLALRLLPAVSPAVRSTVWWLAALKFVIGVVPMPALSLPVLPPALRSDVGAQAIAVAGERTRAMRTVTVDRVAPAADPDATPSLVGGAATRPHTASVLADGTGPTGATTGAGTVAMHGAAATVTDRPAAARWRWLLLAIWGLVVGGHAVRVAACARDVRRLVVRAVLWSDEELAVHRPLIDGFGLRRVPEIRTSSEVAGPLVVGMRRPTVIIPAGDFTPGERTMMLCHELTHVRRRDVAMGWIPAAAERLFFFHPFARLAAREYLVAREAACDAAVVRTLGVAAADYARLLVKLGVSPAQPSMVAGGSARSMSSLKRRLEMLHLASAPRSHRWAWTLVLAAAAVMPLQLGARDTPLPAARATEPQRPLSPAAAQPARDASPAATAQTPTPAVPEQSAAPAGSEHLAAAPAVAAVRGIEEQRAHGGNSPQAETVAPELLNLQAGRVPADGDAAAAREQIERPLQTSRDETQRALEEPQARANDEQARAAAEMQRRAAEQAVRAAESEAAARDAARLQSERAAREVVRLQSEQAARERLQRERAAREVVRLQNERAAREVVRTQAGNEQLAAARARAVELEQKGAPDNPELFRARADVQRLELQEELDRARGIAERARERQRDELERLRVRQEAVARELRQLADQHRMSLEMQQQLAEEAARVLRREVERQP